MGGQARRGTERVVRAGGGGSWQGTGVEGRGAGTDYPMGSQASEEQTWVNTFLLWRVVWNWRAE